MQADIKADRPSYASSKVDCSTDTDTMRQDSPARRQDESKTAADDAIGRSAMRKAMWRILPLILLAYVVAYIDRVNASLPFR